MDATKTTTPKEAIAIIIFMFAICSLNPIVVLAGLGTAWWCWAS